MKIKCSMKGSSHHLNVPADDSFEKELCSKQISPRKQLTVKTILAGGVRQWQRRVRISKAATGLTQEAQHSPQTKVSEWQYPSFTKAASLLNVKSHSR